MTVYFSRQGLDRFDEQIAQQRQTVIDAGQQVGEEAGVSCDWHDNFGFEEARRKLDLESERLRNMVTLREKAQVVELPTQPSRVSIGCHVVFLLDDDERHFTIGAWGEVSTKDKLVAYDSPIAKLVMGMEPGDYRNAIFQGRDVEVEVLSIENDCRKYLQSLEQIYG